MRQAVTLLFIAGITAGCAGQGVHPESVKEYTYDPSASLAKNVVDAAGIEGLEDLPREDYEALVEENPELRGIDPRGSVGGSDAANTLGATAAGIAGAMDPIAGLGDLATGALGALSWLAEDNRTAAQKNWMIVWLPEGMTLVEFEREITYAYAQAFGFNPDNMKEAYFDSFAGKDNLTIAPIDCPAAGERFDRSCSFTRDSTRYQLSSKEDGLEKDDFNLPVINQAPSFLSGDSRTRGPILVKDYLSYRGASEEDYDMGLMMRYSKNLPDYVYYYLSSIRTERVAPRVLHMGESHFFIEP